MPTQLLRRFALSTLVISAAACGTDNTAAPEPRPTATLTISPPIGTVYEADQVVLQAVYRDSTGAIVPNAPVTWSVQDTTRAALAANGSLLALKDGVVRVTARTADVSASYELTIVRPPVVSVEVLLPTPTLSRGDVATFGVRVQGPGGRVVLGRLPALVSDAPNVAVIDASGRVRAVAPGVATIRATVEGLVGAAQLVVTDTDTRLQLSRFNGARLPLLISGDTVEWNGVKEYHEVYAESGTLTLSGTSQPRYAVLVRFQEYNVIWRDGQRGLELRAPQGEVDRGMVQYDARGDLQLTSETSYPLNHRASAISGGMELRYRIPGTHEYLQLFFRREPE